MMTPKERRLTAIRSLRAAGFALFPCAGKVPSRRGVNWCETRPDQYTDEELAYRNYAVALKVDQLVVDVDPRNFKPGDNPLRRLIAAVGEETFRKSFRVQTGGGGLHIYLMVKVPEGMEIADSKDYPGINFKHHGGYVIAPGSIHPDTKKPYVIAGGDPTELVAAPQALLNIVLRPIVRSFSAAGTESFIDDVATRARFEDYLLTAPHSIQGQGGNATAFKVAARGRDMALPPETAWRMMTEGEWNSRCTPPWSADELHSVVENAYRYARGAVGNAHPAADFASIPETASEHHNITTHSNRRSMTLVPIDFSNLPEPRPVQMYLMNRLAVGYPNILYAEGGKGKSLLALAIATCAAAGLKFCGLDLPAGPVLYLDWELSQDGQLARAFMVARGLGLQSPPKGLLYLSPMRSLPDLIAELKRLVESIKPVLIIVDSMGPAAGGSPEDAEDTITLFDSLRHLGVTSLILDHQAKMQQGHDYRKKTVFGSVYKFNLSRSVLHLEQVSHVPGTGEVRLILRQTKSNFGPYAEDLALLARFRSKSVTYEAVDAARDPAFAKVLTISDKLIAAIRAHGPVSAQAMAEITGEVIGSIKNELTRLRKSGQIMKAGQNGRQTRWALHESSVTASQPYMAVTSDPLGLEELH